MKNKISNYKTPTKETLLYLVSKVKALFLPKQQGALPEAVAALQQCQNIEQLLDLLFATDFHNDEAFLRLFERRIDELDRCYSQAPIIPFSNQQIQQSWK